MPFELSTCVEIIGFLSSTVTVEEAARTWIKEIREKFSDKPFDFDEYKSENENVNRKLDHLKQYLTDSGRKEIISDEEIGKIKGEIGKSACLDYYEQKELDEIIDCFFAGINQYINEHLTMGEKLIFSKQMEMIHSINKLGESIKDSESRQETKINRFITDIAPDPPGKFGYRETEIGEIVNLLKDKKHIAICGVGGIGKTSILRYMYQYHMDHTSYYLGWIPYSGNLKKDLLDRCQLAKDILDVDERENVIKKFLHENNREVVLFIDNVTEDILRDSLFDFLSKTVRVFISTRYWSEDDLFTKYEVGSVQPGNAIDLFWDYYGKKPEDSEVEKKIETLMQGINYHTLMIEMVAKAAQFAEETLLEFIEKVIETGYGYSEDEIRTAHDKNEETIAGHLSKLYKLETNSGEKNDILYNFAIMKDSILPFDFRKWISDKDNIGESKKNFKWLIERGWIKKETNGYSMHPVVKQSILMQEKIKVHSIAALIGSIQDNGYFDEMLDCVKLNQRIDIAESILEYFAPYKGENAIALGVMEGFVLACGQQSRFDEGIKFALKEYEWSLLEFKDSYNECTAGALYNLARILHLARRFDEARKYCDTLYDICKKIYAQNDMNLFYFREVYIEICIEQKDYLTAMREYEDAKAMENPEITDEKRLKIDMAYCAMLINEYLDTITGKIRLPDGNADSLLDDAEKVLLRIHPLLNTKYGEDHLEMLPWYQNMANIYSYRDDFYRALEYDKKIVEIREEKLGGMNGKLAEAYFNLADDLYRIAVSEGKTAEEALDYINKSYEIIVQVYAESKMKTDAERLMMLIKEHQEKTFFN